MKFITALFLTAFLAFAVGIYGILPWWSFVVTSFLVSVAIHQRAVKAFLAGFLGLGKVTDKIMGVIQKVRTTVDKAIDAAIAWIVGKAKALFVKLFVKDKKDERTPEKKQADGGMLAGLGGAYLPFPIPLDGRRI